MHDMEDAMDMCVALSLGQKEILFLETDSEARDKAIFEEKMKSRGQVQRLWASVYWSEQHKELSSLNRLRPMQEGSAVRRQRRLREVRRRQRRAKAVFLQKCREKFGSCARAWRRGIDPEGKFYVDKLTLRHFCRGQEIDKHVDLQSLWTTLDSDKDGRIGVQDISPLGAVALASFRAWCRQISGSCRAVWNLPELVDARSSPQKEGSVTVLLNSERKILLRKFVECLKALGWKCSGDQAEMLSALDYFNVGFISEADLYWLDTWDRLQSRFGAVHGNCLLTPQYAGFLLVTSQEPPLFLTAQASEEAWNEIREILLEIYGTPLNAWRHLDIDGQNEVSWAEFVHKLWPVRTFTTSVYRTWQLESLQLQLCITDDIVTSPPFGFCNVLINPANKVVWNGSRIFYVLSYAGGEAVITDATEGLKDFFEHIVHAAPPMYTSTDWEHKLSRCWKAALEKAWSLGLGTSLKVASPLLGAGACGAPVEEAAQVAARAFVKWAATPVGGAWAGFLITGVKPIGFLNVEFGGVLSLGTREEAIAATVEAEVVRALTLKSLSEKRLAVNATKWGLDQDALNGKLTPEAPQKVPKKSARLAQLKARCQDLETELHRHLEEEEKRKSEVLQRFKAECDSILRSQEEDCYCFPLRPAHARELLQLRRAAVTQEADAAQRGVAHFKQEVLEQLQRIQKQLAETKDHVSELDRLKQGLDNIEERQRRAIPPIEALLASTMDTWPEDTEDELLAANIRKGEQVCKRLRRHQSK
eukprot:g31077.t1